MNLFRARRVRLPALVACLALFLAGSNYCLLSAWAGNTSMACLVAPGEAPAAKAAKCGHCAPATKPATGGETGQSCCPAPVVTPSAPTVEKGSAFAGPPVTAFIAAVIVSSAPHASAWHGRQHVPDAQPPTRLARPPLPARAPPLA